MITLENLDADIANCNFRCAACNHAAPFAHIPMMRPEELACDLGVLGKFLHANRFTLIGGEPTLSPFLLSLMDVVRSSNIADTLQVSTNGSLLHLMPESFWGKIDRLQVSVYPRSIGDNRALAEAKAAQYHFTLLQPSTPFHKCLVAQPRSDADALANYRNCCYRTECWSVFHGYLYRCPAGPKIPGRWMGLPATIDGIALDDDLTEEKLLAFINRQAPAHACYLCDYQKSYIEWHECSDEETWKQDSTR